MKKTLLFTAILAAMASQVNAASQGPGPDPMLELPGKVQELDQKVEQQTSKLEQQASKLEQQAIDAAIALGELRADVEQGLGHKFVQENAVNPDTLEGQIVANAGSIGEAKADIAKNQAAIQDNKTQISQNTNDIHGLQQQAVENQAAIKDNKTQISQNTNDIHGLQQQAVENALHDKNQDQNIAVNQSNIEKNKQAISANSEAIAKNYAEMKNNFAAVNSRIDNLDEEMKKGFASQAALSGLFQPYNVGKFNLSVAMGGYESEQAIALGTGYRFNENFAMKAAIATDVGGFDHVTYNVGANFEW